MEEREKIFRQKHCVVTFLVKLLISRNFRQKRVRENFPQWKFQHFSVTSIVREINFEESISSKLPFLASLEALSFVN